MSAGHKPDCDPPPARIVLDENGVPVIADANTKVVEIVSHWKAYQETPEEIAENLPHLRVGQVEAALEYYETHRQEIEEDLARRLEMVERLRKEMGQPAVVERLRHLVPNQETIEAMKAARRNELSTAGGVGELLAELHADD